MCSRALGSCNPSRLSVLAHTDRHSQTQLGISACICMHGCTAIKPNQTNYAVDAAHICKSHINSPKMKACRTPVSSSPLIKTPSLHNPQLNCCFTHIDPKLTKLNAAPQTNKRTEEGNTAVTRSSFHDNAEVKPGRL